MKIKLSRTGQTLSVLVGILIAMIVSGCVSPGAASTRTTADYIVTINFDNNGCPIDVTPPSQPSCSVKADKGVCANPNKGIQWVSNPVGTPFEIYFDPFVGRPYQSNPPDEKTRAIVIDRDTKAGIYKYSVYGEDCTGGNPVLDPPIRVEF